MLSNRWNFKDIGSPMTSFGGHMAKDFLSNITRGVWNIEIVYYLLDIFESQTWGALHKCWVGFVIAKEKMEGDKIDLYAKRIQNLERELGIEVTDFSDWGIE